MEGESLVDLERACAAACKGPKTFSEKLTAWSGREVVTANRKSSVDSNEFRGKPINDSCCVLRYSKSATETPRPGSSTLGGGLVRAWEQYAGRWVGEGLGAVRWEVGW